MGLLFSFLMGCQSEPAETPTPSVIEGQVVVHSQNVWENSSVSPSKSAESTLLTQDELTYTFEAWTRGSDAQCVLHTTATGSVPGGVQLNIALVPGTYDFLFWADYGTGHYLTTDLRRVQVVTAPYQAGSSNDAFAGMLEQVTWAAGKTGYQVQLKRPVANVTFSDTKANEQANRMEGTYGEVYTVYDVLTGEVSVPLSALSVSFPETVIGSMVLGEDFLFVPQAGQSFSLTLSVGEVTKKMDDIPLKPNYKTRITSSF